MSEKVTVRLDRSYADYLDRDGTLRGLLERRGLDTRSMSCREEGGELVYEGLPLPQVMPDRSRRGS